MDLLRLVLSHQPLEILRSKLPRLLKSGNFILVRTRIINVSSPLRRRCATVGEYVRLCTSQGELCRLSILYADKRNLTARCIFLRDVENYLYFSVATENSLDLWLAIGSGIPEIQAMAMAQYWSIGATEKLCSLQLPWAVPWTPALRKRVLHWLENNGEEGSRKSLLLHYLKEDPTKYGTEEEVCGFLYSRTQNKSIVERDPILAKYLKQFSNKWSVTRYTEFLVRTGYLYPVLERLKMKRSDSELYEIACIDLATKWLRVPILEYFSYQMNWLYIGERSFYTIDDALAAREILDNPDSIKLPETIYHFYCALAGYESFGVDTVSLRSKILHQNRIIEKGKFEIDPLKELVFTAQDILAYDTRSVIFHLNPALYSLKAARGHLMMPRGILKEAMEIRALDVDNIQLSSGMKMVMTHYYNFLKELNL